MSGSPGSYFNLEKHRAELQPAQSTVRLLSHALVGKHAEKEDGSVLPQFILLRVF
jgi:hypothetical protein